MAVARSSVGLRADYSLLSDLREFQAEYNGSDAPAVRVRLNFKLIRMPQRVIVGTTNIERSVKAAGTRLEDIVLAYDDALGKVLRRMVEWTLQSLPVRVVDPDRR
jgi:cholesterol transport system auxiliary component